MCQVAGLQGQALLELCRLLPAWPGPLHISLPQSLSGLPRTRTALTTGEAACALDLLRA